MVDLDLSELDKETVTSYVNELTLVLNNKEKLAKMITDLTENYHIKNKPEIIAALTNLLTVNHESKQNIIIEQ